MTNYKKCLTSVLAGRVSPPNACCDLLRDQYLLFSEFLVDILLLSIKIKVSEKLKNSP